MLKKTKKIAQDLSSGITSGVYSAIFTSNQKLYPKDVAKARDYIKQYWAQLSRFHPKDDENLLGLPKPYLVPASNAGSEYDFDELYYWDSYFIAQGLLNQDNKDMVMGILEDLIHLFNRYKIIPNASRTYLTGRSQPPLLTSFIFNVYEAYDLGLNWLGKMIKIAEAEYVTVWTGTQKPNARRVYQGLSRYYDTNYLHDLAEAESGWDMTPRFNRRCLDYLPVDLNSLLYKYESDFARYYRLIDNVKIASQWEVAANYRKEHINSLMWSNLRGLYFDYNYSKEKRGTVASLASYYPLWAGLADEEQAAQLVKNLRKFEQRGGLSTTDTMPLNNIFRGYPMQWAYPNGWAPLHFIVVKGLQRYGYDKEAKRIATKWLKSNLDWFNKHGVFLEKYNVVSPNRPPAPGLYPSQTGFGWTNSVFERFCQEFVSAEP